MEEIPNNHLGCIKTLVNNGINYQPQLVSRISSINRMMYFSKPSGSQFQGQLNLQNQLMDVIQSLFFLVASTPF